MPARDADDAVALLDRLVADLPGGSPRPGQREMARLAAEALERRGRVAIQAGTGVGKSLAYLAAAALHDSPVVVVTATKALQRQLADKDLPFVEADVDGLTHAVLQGRSNYLCLQRAAEVLEADEQSRLTGTDADQETLASLARWGVDHPTGDRADLDEEPGDDTWARISVGSDQCPGATKCPSGERCHAEAARRRAAEVDVVVVNSHLYALDLATEGRVVPDHDAVVVDEAHVLEEVLSSALARNVGRGRWEAVAGAVGAVVDDRALGDRLRAVGDRLLSAAERHAGRRVRPSDDEALSAWLDLAAGRAAEVVQVLARLPSDGPVETVGRVQRARRMADGLVEDLQRLAEPGPDDAVWVAEPAHDPRLSIAPIAVASSVAEAWGERAVVLTSATLPPGIGDRLGLGEVPAHVVESPFDHRRAAMLYVARHLPPPSAPAWREAARAELEALVRAAQGRTLALFTSRSAMNEAAEHLAEALDWPVLVQGELPKARLLERFATEEHTTLCATMGFWQGVDVPGRTLSLVVIDRLPFSRPDDPLLEARREKAGDAAFRTIDVPRAAMLLAQGAGRLLRTSTDRGVVAVLDQRLATRDYRRDLLACVPPLKRSIDRAEVEAFLAEVIADETPHPDTAAARG